ARPREDVARGAVARAPADGARAADSISDCVRDAEILLTSLPGPPQVDAVLCGADGGESAIAAMTPGSIVVDMSTSSLEVGRKARAAAAGAGGELLDGPLGRPASRRRV